MGGEVEGPKVTKPSQGGRYSTPPGLNRKISEGPTPTRQALRNRNHQNTVQQPRTLM